MKLMKMFLFVALALFSSFTLSADEDKAKVDELFNYCLTSGVAYKDLEDLCTNVGHRLSGSKNAEKAVLWAQKTMTDLGFDKVILQEVMVPHWERGAPETAFIVGDKDPLSILALGGSIATPINGIKAKVVMVNSIEEVNAMGDEAKGKIVFYNRAFPCDVITTGAGYGRTVDQRTQGALTAAKKGAVGVIIRSVGSANDDFPHTGTMRYDDEVKKIPAGALGVKSADRLVKALENNKNLSLSFTINAQWYDDVLSYNVIGELTGSEFPDEYIIVGGHLDSWDVGHGAHDDGTGCVHSIGAVNALLKTGYKPRHSIRAVLYMNEENGLKGGLKYAEMADKNNEKHLFAIESDGGGFTPRGFGISGADEAVAKMQAWLPLFDKNTISYITVGGGGADIGPLKTNQKTPVCSFNGDSQRYFDLHHTNNDTFDKVNRRELELGTASIASLLYLVDKYGL